MKTDKSNNGIIRRKGKILRRLLISFCCVLVISAATYFIIKIFDSKLNNETSVSRLYKEWEQYNYKEVYDRSAAILKNKPFNNVALTLHGYSAFFLALSENDTAEFQNLLDESINNIRVALQNAKSQTLSQLEYMLGKAYFYKNTAASYYYYADLAVLYLNRALKDGYKADDIPEYLGLSYASLGMTMESISAFTKALLTRESDTLLLSIAEQYYKAGQSAASEQYLYRISQNCTDQKITEKTHILLGTIYTENKKFTDAENEFQTILQNNENSADAYYGLGIIYENQGDLVKARSQWRKVLRVQPNHAGALKKIAEYK